MGWGSTRGAIEEAVDRARAEGIAVSSLHLRFLSPFEPELKSIFSKFRKVVTAEINYSDPIDDEFLATEHRRFAQLAWVLRARTLVDIGCFSNVHGQPMRPNSILNAIRSISQPQNA